MTATVGVQRTSIARGAAFTVGMRWLSRLVGIVSTLILARLLTPDDFGVTAMASIALGLTSVLLDLGVNVALIRNRDASDAHFHSAWTLRIAQATVIAITLAVMSPWAGGYFHDHRVTPVLWVLATTVLISSFENIGIVSFQKEMQFGREFRYLVTNRLFAFVATISLALVLRNYWALVLGGLAGALFTVANSYHAHPMRPRPSVAKVREIFGVSQWMLAQNIGNYFDDNLHKLLVGRREDAAVMGGYSLAAEIAAMPSTELLQPLNRVLFPAFVAVKHDLDQLKRTFLLAQGLQVLVAFPAAVFLSYLAQDVVAVLLGAKWAAAAPFLQSLALGSALWAIRSSAWYVGVTLGQERRSAAVSWLQVGLFVGAAVLLFPRIGAREIAQLRVLLPAVGLVIQLWIVSRALGNLTALEMLVGVWRPVVAVGATLALLHVAHVRALYPLVDLLIKLAICTLGYSGLTYLLWRQSGRPEGAESYLLALAQRLKRRRSTEATDGAS